MRIDVFPSCTLLSGKQTYFMIDKQLSCSKVLFLNTFKRLTTKQIKLVINNLLPYLEPEGFIVDYIAPSC